MYGIRSCLQLNFDGPFLSILTWPHIISDGKEYAPGSRDYRDTLCALIGKTVGAVYEDNEKITLSFASEHILKISLRDEDRISAEAVIFQDRGGEVWNLW